MIAFSWAMLFCATALALAGATRTLSSQQLTNTTAVEQTGSRSYAAVREADTLFGLTKVWTFHLRFEPEAWERLVSSEPDAPGSPGGADPTNYVAARLEFEGQAWPSIGVRVKGNSSFRAAGDSLKRSLKLDFNRYNRSSRFYGLTKLNLNNNAMDPSQMREALAYEVFRQAGIPAPRTAFARLYLSAPGKLERKYAGLYTMVEQVDDHFLRLHFGAKKGLLLKPERTQGLAYLGEDWEPYARRFDPKSYVDADDARRLIDFARLIHEGNEKTFREQIGAFIDVQQLLRFLAVEAALANLDSPLFTGHNFYLYLHPGSGRFSLFPWDMNEAFGGFFVAGNARQQADLSISHPFGPGTRLFERVLAAQDMKAHFRRQFEDLLANAFSTTNLFALIDSVAAAIRQAVVEDKHADIGQFDRNLEEGPAKDLEAISGRPEPPRRLDPDGAGNEPPRRPMMRMPKPPLRTFIAARAASIRSQLDGKAEGYVPRGRGFDPPPDPLRRPGLLVTPAVMRVGDTDRNGNISRKEWEALAARWFEDWDADNSGALDLDKLMAGLRQILPPPPDRAARGNGPAPFPPEGEPDLAPPPDGPQPAPPDRAGPGARREGRPFGPARMDRPRGEPLAIFARQMTEAVDADRDGLISKAEFSSAFGRWFAEWNHNGDDSLEEPEVVEGFSRLLGPRQEPSRARRPTGSPRF